MPRGTSGAPGDGWVATDKVATKHPRGLSFRDHKFVLYGAFAEHDGQEYGRCSPRSTQVRCRSEARCQVVPRKEPESIPAYHRDLTGWIDETREGFPVKSDVDMRHGFSIGHIPTVRHFRLTCPSILAAAR